VIAFYGFSLTIKINKLYDRSNAAFVTNNRQAND